MLKVRALKCLVISRIATPRPLSPLYSMSGKRPQPSSDYGEPPLLKKPHIDANLSQLSQTTVAETAAAAKNAIDFLREIVQSLVHQSGNIDPV